jgi:hypothetical protein
MADLQGQAPEGTTAYSDLRLGWQLARRHEISVSSIFKAAPFSRPTFGCGRLDSVCSIHPLAATTFTLALLPKCWTKQLRKVDYAPYFLTAPFTGSRELPCRLRR